MGIACVRGVGKAILTLTVAWVLTGCVPVSQPVGIGASTGAATAAPHPATSPTMPAAAGESALSGAAPAASGGTRGAVTAPTAGAQAYGTATSATAATAGFATSIPSGTQEPSYLLARGLRVLGGPEGTHGIAATDGSTVVWADALDRIRAARVGDGQEYQPIEAPSGAGGSFSVSGEIVAWRVQEEPGPACPPDCPGYIAAMNLATHAAFPLVKTHHNELWPRVSGDWLVWLAEDPLPVPLTRAVPGPQGNAVVTSTLLARNLRTMAEPIVLRQTTDPVSIPQVDGDRVVWAEQQETTPGHVRATILVERMGGGRPQVLVQGEDISPYGYDLRGDLLIYTTAAQDVVWAVNLKTGWRKSFPGAISPATDGRYIFWVDLSRSPSRKIRQDLWGYDTATDTTFPLTVNAGVSDYPDARNGVVAWMYHEGTLSAVSHVYVADIAEMRGVTK